jgi:hypothetical protein
MRGVDRYGFEDGRGRKDWDRWKDGQRRSGSKLEGVEHRWRGSTGLGSIEGGIEMIGNEKGRGRMVWKHTQRGVVERDRFHEGKDREDSLKRGG